MMIPTLRHQSCFEENSIPQAFYTLFCKNQCVQFVGLVACSIIFTLLMFLRKHIITWSRWLILLSE